MGAIGDQGSLRIASEIHVDDKPPGYEYAGTHPRLTGEEFLASLQDVSTWTKTAIGWLPAAEPESSSVAA